jgi:hypothetical protein
LKNSTIKPNAECSRYHKNCRKIRTIFRQHRNRLHFRSITAGLSGNLYHRHGYYPAGKTHC